MLIHLKSMHFSSKLALLLVFWFSCCSTAEINHKEQSARVEEITIFVHGVIGLKLSISAYHLFNLVRDKTANTVYEKTIEGVRNDPFFFENQPISHVGLHKIDIEELKPGNAGVLAAYLYDSVDAYSQFTNAKHSYFTYGWSGLLSKQAREAESEEFLNKLENLCAEKRSQGIEPKIRLIGFSHGGNLCMQLAHAKERLKKDTCMVIDELVLVGTPILAETKTALNDPLFARVYNIYSPADNVQEKEIFSGEFFSARAFEAAPDAPLPAKLTQIELHVKKDRIKKNRYTKKEKNLGTADYSPGHMELWFFGWTPNHYRTDYPLHPLPTVVFAPYIINRLQELDLDQNKIVLTLHPENNTMSVGTKTMPFLTPAILQSLKDTAQSYAPEEYSVAEYREHCKQAYWAAREDRTPLPARR